MSETTKPDDWTEDDEADVLGFQFTENAIDKPFTLDDYSLRCIGRALMERDRKLEAENQKLVEENERLKAELSTCDEIRKDQAEAMVRLAEENGRRVKEGEKTYDLLREFMYSYRVSEDQDRLFERIKKHIADIERDEE